MSPWRGIRRLARLLLACWPAVLSAQVPAGPEFRVNTYATGSQDSSAAAISATGNFVVT